MKPKAQHLYTVKSGLVVFELPNRGVVSLQGFIGLEGLSGELLPLTLTTAGLVGLEGKVCRGEVRDDHRLQRFDERANVYEYVPAPPEPDAKAPNKAATGLRCIRE